MHYNWTKKCNERIKRNQEFDLKLFCNWIWITVRGLYKMLRKIILVWFQLLLRPRQIEAAVDESLILLLHNELCCHKAHLSVFEMQSMFLISWWIGTYKEVSAADVGQLSDLSVSGFAGVSSVWVQNQKLFRKYFQMGFFFIWQRRAAAFVIWAYVHPCRWARPLPHITYTHFSHYLSVVFPRLMFTRCRRKQMRERQTDFEKELDKVK